MNCTELKYWQIVMREGEEVNIKNYFNAKKNFDGFHFYGLENFEYFRLGLYKEESIEPKYKDTMLAYIDILGFKNWLDSKKALAVIFRTMNEILKSVDPEIRFGTSKINSKLISDTLVIWTEIEKEANNVTVFLILVSTVIAKIHKIGNVVTRGAISCDEHFDNGQIFISKALVASYCGETNEANYLRTIFLPSAMKKINEIGDSLLRSEYWVKTDIDGYHFINYLNLISDNYKLSGNTIIAECWTKGSMRDKEYIQDLKKHKETIEFGLNENKNNQKIRSKYMWLANYHNNYVNSNKNIESSDDLTINLIVFL